MDNPLARKIADLVRPGYGNFLPPNLVHFLSNHQTDVIQALILFVYPEMTKYGYIQNTYYLEFTVLKLPSREQITILVNIKDGQFFIRPGHFVHLYPNARGYKTLMLIINYTQTNYHLFIEFLLRKISPTSFSATDAAHFVVDRLISNDMYDPDTKAFIAEQRAIDSDRRRRHNSGQSSDDAIGIPYDLDPGVEEGLPIQSAILPNINPQHIRYVYPTVIGRPARPINSEHVGDGYMANLNAIGSGNTHSGRVAPTPQSNGSESLRIESILILKSRSQTRYKLVIMYYVNGTPMYIIIHQPDGGSIEFNTANVRPDSPHRWNVDFDDGITVSQFLTSGHPNRTGSIKSYIIDRLTANNMMTTAIGSFMRNMIPPNAVIPFNVLNIDHDWLTFDGQELQGEGKNNILPTNKMPRSKKIGMRGGADQPTLELMPPPTAAEWRARRRAEREEREAQQRAINRGDKARGGDAMQEMLGGSMHEMEELYGGAWHDWLSNLVNVIRKPKEALGKMPKPIWEFNQKYNHYGIVSMQICREPLSKGLQYIIDKSSKGELLKNLKDSPYEDLFHLYANVYLKNPLTGQTKSFRVEKNQRCEIFDNIVPPKGTTGACMSVPNIPMKNGLPTLGWFKFWENTDSTTFEYSADKWNCQAFLKTRLEALGLLTPELKNFIMQDIDQLVPGAEFQKSIAKGITNFANIMQNIYMGGEMGGDGMKGGFVEPHVHYKEGDYPDVTSQNVSLGMSKYYPVQTDPRQIGKGKKKSKNQRGGWVEPHIHQVWVKEGVGWTGPVRAEHTDPDFGKH